MPYARLMLCLLLCGAFCGSAWYAINTLSGAVRQRRTVDRLEAELSSLRTRRGQLEGRMERAERAVRLLEQAVAEGIDPDGWMRSSFVLDTERELDVLLASDPLLKRLRQEKERIVKEQSNTRVRNSGSGDIRGGLKSFAGQGVRSRLDAGNTTENVLQRVEERIRLRTQWLEAQTVYTGEAVRLLLDDLSDGSQGALFVPDSFELTRVAANRYEVLVRGIFLTPIRPVAFGAGS